VKVEFFVFFVFVVGTPLHRPGHRSPDYTRGEAARAATLKLLTKPHLGTPGGDGLDG